MKTITIPVSDIQDKGYCLTTHHTLVMTNGTRCSIGSIARGDAGRKVMGGDKVPGPWAWTSPRAITIAANPMHGTYGDIQRGLAAGTEHTVANGDHVVFDNVEYAVAYTDNHGCSTRGSLDRMKLTVVRDLLAVPTDPTPATVSAYDALTAKVKALATELPGVTFGYIGNCGVDRSGPFDDRCWRIFLPHPGRVGGLSDSVTLGHTSTLETALLEWDRHAATARRLYARGGRS